MRWPSASLEIAIATSFLFLFDTGCRLSEALVSPVSDVNFEDYS
jgi:hypothetical protein